MILTCPNCATRYLTTPEDIGPKGRTVRCSSCQTSWYVKAEADILDLADQESSAPNKSPVPNKVSNKISVPQPSLTAKQGTAKQGKVSAQAGIEAAAQIRDKTYRKRAARRMMGVGLLWGTTLAILGLGAGAAYYLRQPIVQKYPAAATLYKGFGVQVAQNGLILESVTVNSAYIEGVPTVLVEGELSNIDRVSRLAGPIYFDMLDVAGQSLASWTYEAETGPIEPASSLSFVDQYANPPIDAVRLRYGLSTYEAPDLDSDSELGSVSDSDLDSELALTPLAPLPR